MKSLTPFCGACRALSLALSVAFLAVSFAAPGQVPDSSCEVGRERQSPIDVGSAEPAALPPLAVTARPILAVKHTGKSLEMTYRGGYLTVGNVTAVLKESHFHRPAEHTKGSDSFPMELHLVHEDEKGGLHVIGVWLRPAAGAAPGWERLLTSKTPRKEGETFVYPPDQSVSVYDLLPKDLRYVTYDGSLTTPPFTQSVTWYVLEEPAALPTGWVSRYADLFSLLYSRDVQPLCGRSVRKAKR